MTRRLLIVGAGYTGLHLAERAVDAGWDVAGTTRNAERAERLAALGANAILWGGGDPIDDLAEWIDADTSIVYSIPTLHREVPEDGEHLELPRRVLELADRCSAESAVYLSSTSVYGDHDGAWVDEDSERRPDTPLGVMRRDIEDLFLAWTTTPTNVVRIAGIYGPGRSIADYMASGRYRIVDPDKVTNRVHVEDLVSIIFAVVSRDVPARRVYLAADGDPVRVGDLVDFLVDRGMSRPPSITIEEYAATRGPSAAARWRTTTRIANQRAREELDVTFQFPNVFAFYETTSTSD